MLTKTYLCIDLKSFYASVECKERGLDSLTTNLVVADPSRTDKTICLAITPSMKKLGIKNRCRLFEIPKNIEYIIAPPRMQKYIEYSAHIYSIYLKYIAKEDLHVYSIDECFLDVSNYLSLYQLSAYELGKRILEDIIREAGIYATCGIGSNLYLAKIALDLTAKHASDYIGILTEDSFCETLSDHRPLTDFWRIGAGTARKLETYGIYTMRQIRETKEEFLYRLFGIDAELLIDHAYGREPVTMADIKSYKPSSHSLTSGQVLGVDYSFEEGVLIVREMMDLLCLDLLSKNLVTKSITLHIGYAYHLNVKSAHGTVTLPLETNSDTLILPAVTDLYRKIVNPNHFIRRVHIYCNKIAPEENQQYNLFVDTGELERNRQIQKAVIDIKNKYGKNAILKGMNLEEKAMTKERNQQIGGHKA